MPGDTPNALRGESDSGSAPPDNPYAATANHAQSLTTDQLASVLYNYNQNNHALTADDRLHQGIYGLEYMRRVAPPTAQYNMQTRDGRLVPVTEWEGAQGYDPTDASMASWQALIHGTQIPHVGLRPGIDVPYNQTYSAWNVADTAPGHRPASVGYASAGPRMEYDSTTGLPITDAGPNSAASHFSMGGPDAQPYPASQVFNPRPGPYLAPTQASGAPQAAAPASGSPLFAIPASVAPQAAAPSASYNAPRLPMIGHVQDPPAAAPSPHWWDDVPGLV